jgi:hypothetical protein
VQIPLVVLEDPFHETAGLLKLLMSGRRGSHLWNRQSETLEVLDIRLDAFMGGLRVLLRIEHTVLKVQSADQWDGVVSSEDLGKPFDVLNDRRLELRALLPRPSQHLLVLPGRPVGDDLRVPACTTDGERPGTERLINLHALRLFRAIFLSLTCSTHRGSKHSVANHYAVGRIRSSSTILASPGLLSESTSPS